jgi:hypothetical protein
MQTFYRWHRTDAPAFNADNAWSGLWGAEFSTDGSQTKCRACDGTGEDWRDCPRCHGEGGDCRRCDGEGVINECADCDGEGWQDCVRGFSSCHTAQDLYAYITGHMGAPSDDDGKVIVFTGHQADTGFDDEPCVVPDEIVKEMTWTELESTL